QNNAFFWNEFAIGGARLWDTDEFCFDAYIEYRENPKAKISDKHPSSEETEKIFQRELLRLETSLKMLEAKARPDQIRIAMTHYPPIGAELHASRAAAILEKYKISVCVFGHLHNVIPGSIPFGIKNGVKYVITACDAVECVPVRIV
nr:metallophosphoesterase [Parachlamydiaceae bacterium]